MSARVTSAFFVGALQRRVFAAGAFMGVLRKGAPEAGAIMIRIDRPDGSGQLYVPAAQASYGEDAGERRFRARFAEGPVDAERIVAVIEREVARDPDVWVIGIDDAAGERFLEGLIAD